MFDDFSFWLLLAFFGLLGIGALISKVVERLRDHKDRHLRR